LNTQHYVNQVELFDASRTTASSGMSSISYIWKAFFPRYLKCYHSQLDQWIDLLLGVFVFRCV